MSLSTRLPALLALIATTSVAADLTTWPSQYTLRPWETSRLTAADVVGPDGIVYPDFTGVGVTGGIPDVNNSTIRAGYAVYNVKSYGAVGDGATNDDNAVASAVTAIKANATAGGKSILYFPAGTYLLSQPIVFGLNSSSANVLSNHIVVDGDGPSATLLKIATNTSVSGALITFTKKPNYGGQTTLGSFIPRGGNSLVLPFDPVANGYAVGSWVSLAASVFGAGTTMSDRFNNPDNHVIYADIYGQHTGRAFMAKVFSVNGTTRTITFDRTFTHDFFVDEAPRIRNYTVSEYCGVQDLAIETLAANATLDPIAFDKAANCWIKNIKDVKARNDPYTLVSVTRFEVRDSQFLGSWSPIGSGANAYLGWISSTDSLMDNCQASDLRHMAIFQYANRSVVRNCTFTGQSVCSPQLHGRFPHDNLIEGTTFQTTVAGSTTDTRGLSAYTSDGAATLRHGVEGPRNVFYNNRVNSGMGSVQLAGLAEGYIFAYNRVLKTDDREAQPPFHIVDRTFDGIIRGNVFQAITTMPFISFEDPTCTGWSVTDNKIYGSNGYLYDGDSAPVLAHNNRFFSASTTPDAATTPEVVSIYAWQRSNANTARLVLVIDRRTVADNGGTTAGTVVRVKASTASSLTVNLSASLPGLNVPGTVTIPAGQVSANFTLTGSDVSGEKLITVTASASGLLGDTEKVAVLDQAATQPNFGGGKWPITTSGLPAGWKAANFGQVSVAGTQSYAPATDTWSISGGGVGIGFNNPAIETSSYQSSLALSGRRFVYQTLDGDGEIRARLTSVTGENQVGLMVADDEGTMTDFVMVEPTGRVLSSSNRNNVNHGKAYVQAFPGAKTVPVWLRIKRTGFVFTAYKSTAANPVSESDWTVLATFDMYRDTLDTTDPQYKSPAILDQRMHFGLFINSGSATTSASATFTGVQISGPASPAPAGNDLIVEESFAYPVGTVGPDPDDGDNANNGLPATNSLDANNVGIGFYGNYGADQSVVSGLSYGNAGGTLLTSGNALRRSSGTGFSASLIRNYRQLLNDPFAAYRAVSSANTFGWNGSSATELYFSVLLNVNAVNTGADNRLVVNLGLDGGSWNVYLAQANGTGQWKYGDQSGAGAVLGTAVANQTVLVVGRLSFNSATQFVTEYWFNPVLGQPLGTPTFAKTYTTTTSGGQFNGIQTRDGANVLTYDEFRLGTTFEAVTPLQ